MLAAGFFLTFGGTWLANVLRPPATIHVYNTLPGACPAPAASSVAPGPTVEPR
jgi:hypothetical protein